MMVSKVRYRSYKDLDLNDKATLYQLFLMLLGFVLVMIQHEMMMFIVLILYILFGLISYIYYFIFKRDLIQEYISEHDLDDEELLEKK